MSGPPAAEAATPAATPEEPAPLALPDLLRKCHRDELLPLAGALKVNPDGLGLGRLAEVISWTLRRAGGHEIGNLLLRRGEGPPYREVVAELARRQRVPTGPDVASAELILLEHWLAQALEQLEPAQRRELWRVLSLDGEPPDSGVDAAHEARAQLGAAGFGLWVGKLAAVSVARFAGMALLPLFGPLMPIATVLYLGRPDDERLLPAVLEVARLRRTVRHRVTVGVVGSPSSGKDAAIKALFGIDSGNVDPVAGSTREVAITRLPGATALYVVNTPGMGDVIEAVTEEARQVLDHIDVFVYVLNAQGGVQQRERDDRGACVARGRPVLTVVNKIDTLRERDRERYLDDARAKLRAAPADFLAAAFDPLPQLSERPIGVEAVRAWITAALVELGKDPAELPWTASQEAACSTD